MKNINLAYYGVSESGKFVLYIPNNLIGIGYDELNFDWDPDTLQGISLLFSKELIWAEDFIKRGWKICKVEIPGYFIKRFQELCLENEKRGDNNLEELVIEKAREISDYVSDLAF